MDKSSPDVSDVDVSFGDPHYDHQQAAYFIPSLDEQEDSVTIRWPLRDEFGTETSSLDAFLVHYTEFCEPAPEAIFEEPLEVILRFAFKEYETLRSQVGGGHSCGLSDVDRVSDLGVSLRLLQKEYDVSFDATVLDEQQ